MIEKLSKTNSKRGETSLKSIGTYDHRKIDKKWQKYWVSKKSFQAKDDRNTEVGPQYSVPQKKFYPLIEFPYPSGDGLHVGHPRPYIGMDVISRKRRAEGYNVLFPIGWDAFGLPTENYAIKTGKDPRVVTKENSATFRRQIQSLGISFDWSREINTSDPKYYKWTQWIFLQFFKKDLAYKKKMAINWCPKDLIGLANEEVVNGCCERCGTQVEKREKEQWMLGITKYADRLDKDLDKVDYLERIKIQQRNWIGRSEGAEIDFPIWQDRNFVLLHGFTATPNDDFHPWLKSKLEALGYKVQVPKLPNTDEPIEKEQVKFVLDNVKFDENTVLLGHSLGSVVALKVLEKLNQKIAGLVTVGGFVDTEFKDHDRNFDKTFIWNFDFNKIKSNTNFIEVMHDKNDVAITDGQAKRLALALGVKVQEVVANDSHFTASEEPILLDILTKSIKIFTTRPDTLFGVTYIVLSPEHSLVSGFLPMLKNKSEAESYIEKAKKQTEIERTDVKKEKTGVELKGIVAVNPANNEKIPVWIADYVLADYGTGAVMAVPAHDERDWEFAKKYGLLVKKVIEPKFVGTTVGNQDCAYIGDGLVIESGKFNGKDSESIKKEIAEFTGGKLVTTFKLRDWVFSRQRYWGEPIPVIHCGAHGAVAVPEKDLPVKLPKVKNYKPTETGESPLATISKWVNAKCPVCKGPAKRETDTMPNWAGSSWYYLRYVDPKNKKTFADPNKLKHWTPVDWYNGGMEHTTLHLLYSRFWHKFLFDLGLVPTDEPYLKRTSHGLILAQNGEKMSKSRGNVINPDTIVATVGADSLRLYEMFMGPFDQPIAWNTDNIAGVRRFVERVWKLRSSVSVDPCLRRDDKTNGNDKKAGYDKTGRDDKMGKGDDSDRIIHKTIRKVSDDIESMRFNTAISALMICLNELEKLGEISVDNYSKFVQLLAPFAPHVSEELWITLGHKESICRAPWPVYDPKLAVDAESTIAVQINGKVRGSFVAPMNCTKEELEKLARGLPEIFKWLEGKTIERVVVIPNRLVNIVTQDRLK